MVEQSVPLATPLKSLHNELQGRMTAFAGYELPIHYSAGLVSEHLHTRQNCGLFDVSHMGQVEIRSASGTPRDVLTELERLIPVDLQSLGAGRQRYGFFTMPDGGILDDLMIANLSDRILVVVNASRKKDDVRHLRANLSDGCSITELTQRALIALQGPKSERALAKLIPAIAAMRFMDVIQAEFNGSPVNISRSGYTGEDGFEVSIASEHAESFARRLLENSDVRAIGLGARDSLRLEAGLCLYGSDLDLDTTPVEAAVQWAIQKSRRSGGARAGGYLGDEIVSRQLEFGAGRVRVGLIGENRQPVRAHSLLFSGLSEALSIGEVTSGCFSPTLSAPIAMAFVQSPFAALGRTVFAEVRGNRIPMKISPMPFVPHAYKRA